MYTRIGLEKLAEIVKSARGHDSVRGFAKKAGISHRTVTRLEEADLKEPEITTLQKIAPLTGYTKEELIAILEAKTHAPQIREYRLAEDVLPIINQLPDAEAAKVAQQIIARLARPKISINGIPGEGVSFHMELLNQKGLADLLRAIAERIEE
ncbi:helix-turn-helix domain-containing protein [Nostoc sp. DedQUE07]|uniref:helix-turn-helix domain-containing protein n=1 Tax=Nostoc sp. DedQUE07 TaxID=3075392 RepID=UPI002AD44A54|nr:helix-turn-helix domain-containing protein [Nostoc sp. DedQUE07]MDZ8131849.1 helix-turn-helix domain-containing protein [Nostoc sp. DedQUE07]